MDSSPRFDITDFPGAVAVVDLGDAAIVTANDQLASLLGTDRHSLSDAGLQAVSADADASPAELRRRIEAAGDDGEFRWTWQDGDGEPTETTVRASRPDDDIAILAVRDATEQDARQRDLETYRQRLDGAMYAGDIAWWEMDVQTGEVLFHEQKTNVLGYDAEDFTHFEDFTDILHPEDYEPAMEAMRAHYQGDAEKYDTEYRIETAEGEYRWFHDVGGITERTAAGEPKKVCGVVVDITKRKEVESRLRDQREELVLLNRLLRHDIRNDMHVVLALVEFVREMDIPEEADERLDRVVAAVEHTTELTESIRVLIETILDDHHDRELQAVGVRSLVDKELTIARESFDATFEVGDIPPVSVRADPMLSSVLRNLLANAVQHNDSTDPHVLLTVDADDDSVEFRVADNGRGVPEAQKDRVFERDEKGDASEGTGVGLYLVRRLVDAYGGDVWITDNDPTGAVFHVELSRADASDSRRSADESAGSTA